MKTTILSLLLLGFACVNAGVLLKTKHYGSMNHRDDLLPQASNNEPLWFTQKLDHFNPADDRQFKQKIYVNETYYKRDGPVFVILGGEGPAAPSGIEGRFIVNNYAQTFNGLIVSFEHRHYGESVPLGSLSKESLKYLSSQQALADYAVLRDFIKSKYDVSLKSKWIAVGGSYSGNLAAWIRNKYPHLFDYALATSAPVKASVAFPEYMSVVQNSLGEECAGVVRKANDEIENLLKTADGRARLSKEFSVCNPIGHTDDDLSTFLSGLADPICGAVQYNLDNNSLGNKLGIKEVCSFMKPEEPLRSLINFTNHYNKVFERECSEGTYENYIKQLQDETPYPKNQNAAGRSWMYQTCMEFGYYQNAVGRDQPFSKYISLPWFLNQCEQLFGVKNVQANVDWTNQYYGQLDIKATNTIFANGNIDPWHKLGLLKGGYVDANNVFFMNGTAHCADLYAPRDTDLESLKNTRARTLELLEKWL